MIFLIPYLQLTVYQFVSAYIVDVPLEAVERIEAE